METHLPLGSIMPHKNYSGLFLVILIPWGCGKSVSEAVWDLLRVSRRLVLLLRVFSVAPRAGLVASWSVSGTSWKFLEASWSLLGLIVELWKTPIHSTWVVLGAAGRILESLGALLGALGRVLEGSWEDLGSILEAFGRCFGGILEFGKRL